MNNPEERYICNEKHCNKIFVNEDQLNSHKKKHRISFNLAITSKSNDTANTGEQTPTPTRFLRNCEEVGLFQDLQNVNPFEETFKKAIENTNNGSLKASVDTNDDTLHTPQVFPTIPQPRDKLIVEDNDLSITNLVEIPRVNEIIPEIDFNRKINEQRENFRNKLKEALLKKDKLKISENKNDNLTDKRKQMIIGTGISQSQASNNMSSCKLLKEKRKKILSKEHKREMNRAAQTRFRVNRKRFYDKIMAELKSLRLENSLLKRDNAYLKKTNLELRSAIENLGTNCTNVMNKLMIDESRAHPIATNLQGEMKRLPPLAPAVKVPPLTAVKIPVQNNGSLPTQPIFYNVIPICFMNTNTNRFSKSKLEGDSKQIFQKS